MWHREGKARIQEPSCPHSTKPLLRKPGQSHLLKGQGHGNPREGTAPIRCISLKGRNHLHATPPCGTVGLTFRGDLDCEQNLLLASTQTAFSKRQLSGGILYFGAIATDINVPSSTSNGNSIDFTKQMNRDQKLISFMIFPLLNEEYWLWKGFFPKKMIHTLNHSVGFFVKSVKIYLNTFLKLIKKLHLVGLPHIIFYLCSCFVITILSGV